MLLKKIVIILVVMILSISLTACGDRTVGTWRGTLDMSGSLTELLTNDAAGKYMELNHIGVDVIFTFGKDGTFQSAIDEGSVKAMVEQLIDIRVSASIAMLQEENVSLEDVGMTEETFRASVASQVDVEEVKELLEQTLVSGFYIYEDDIIYVAAAQESLPENAQEVMHIQIEEDVMTITQLTSFGKSWEDSLPGVLPIELKKQ